MKKRNSIFYWPILFAILTMLGLISALVGIGAWDYFSWVALGIVTLVCVWILLGGRKVVPSSKLTSDR